MTLEQSLSRAQMSGRRYVLLLAENGSGKTSLLKSFACKEEKTTPLYVDLSAAHGDDYILNFLLHAYCGTSRSIVDAAEERAALISLFDREPVGTPGYTLLLDGIDEAPTAMRKELHRELKELSACRDVQIVIAAPSYEYLEKTFFFDWLKDAERLHLQPLSEKSRDTALAEHGIRPEVMKPDLLACLKKPIYLFPFLVLASVDKTKATELSSPAELFSVLLDQDIDKLASQDGQRAHAEYALRYLLPALACRLDKAAFDKDELCTELGKAYFDTSYKREDLDGISTDILTRVKKNLNSGEAFSFSQLVNEDLYKEYVEEIFLRLGYLITDENGFHFKHQHWRYYLQMLHVLNEIHRVKSLALPEALAPEIDRRFLTQARKTGASGEELEQDVRDAWLKANEEREDPRPKRRVWIAVCAAFCVVALAIGVLFWKPDPVPVESMESILPTAGEQQLKENRAADAAVLHLKMEPREMSISEFNRAAETIRERLNCLTEGAPFSLEVHDNTITADLPLSVFQKEDIATILECYISRECRFFLMDYATLSWPNVHMASIPLRPRDFKSVKAIYGQVPALDFDTLGLEEKEYDYLELRMQGGWISEHQEEISGWKELRLAQDISYDTFFSRSDCFLSIDGKSIICLLVEDEAKGFVDAQVYNLQHEPLANGFDIFFEEEIMWEAPEEAMYTGELQCAVDDFSDATLTLYYDTSIESIKTGTWIDTLSVTKKRLDSLGRPYAVGYQMVRGKLRLVIKTYPEHWNSQFFSFLTIRYPDQHTKVVSGLHKFDEFYHDLQAEILEQDDGTLLFKLGYAPNTYRDPEGFASFAHTCADAGETELWLQINNIPVLSGPIESVAEDGAILFTTVFCSGEQIGREQRWLLDFLRELICGEELPDYISFFGGETDIGKGKSIKERYALSYDSLTTALKETITRVQPDSYVYFSLKSPDTVYVDLNLPVDEELPDRAIDAVKRVMEQLDMETLYCHSLMFYLIEEDDVTQERARIFFEKDYSNERITYGTYFMNGRLEKYKDDFKQLMANDPFSSLEPSVIKFQAYEF